MKGSSRLIWLVVGSVLFFVLVLTLQGRGDQPVQGLQEQNSFDEADDLAPGPAAHRVGYVVSRDGAVLRPASGEAGEEVASGIIFAVTAESAGGYQVLDPCNREGWLSADHVEVGWVPLENAQTFDSAVFVIDPGHGLPDLGAVGSRGLTETEVNSEVSARIVELLLSPRDIDWTTGEVNPGDSVPAAATAVMSRPADGPNGGDYEVGLTFRAELANSMAATALVSIHHNSGPETSLDHPGSEAYVSANDYESARLGGLIVEELRRGLTAFDADWMGATGSGVVSRVDQDGDDFYTVLGVPEVPAVIVEGAYISNPSEEALARTDEFRQAYAESVYRALVRFVTTEDDPIPAPDPELFVVDGPGRSLDDCHVPAP